MYSPTTFINLRRCPQPSNTSWSSVRKPLPDSKARVKDSSNSDVSQLTLTISEHLSNNTYECVVCFDTVGRRDEVWGCDTCYKVFHLSCIKVWAHKSQQGTCG